MMSCLMLSHSPAVSLVTYSSIYLFKVIENESFIQKSQHISVSPPPLTDDRHIVFGSVVAIGVVVCIIVCVIP